MNNYIMLVKNHLDYFIRWEIIAVEITLVKTQYAVCFCFYVREHQIKSRNFVSTCLSTYFLPTYHSIYVLEKRSKC